MYKLLALTLCVTVLSFSSYAQQKPKDGVYTYDVAFAEWGGQTFGATVIVKIQGDSVFVIHNGGNITGKRGDIIEKGVLLQHKTTGKWIIARRPEDAEAKEIGACSMGPVEIDFERKRIWSC
jgi:hypothetical protein